MRQRTNVISALRHKELFGRLPEYRNLTSWFAWIVWLKAVFGLPMDEAELELFRRCTGRSSPPAGGAKESATIVGRRGGKSKQAACVGGFIGCFFNFAPYLSTGERPMVLILARDRDQAKVVFGYLAGILRAVPALAAMIVAERGDEIEISNGVIFAVKTSDFRAIRGITVVCCICDEVAFWNFDSDSANPDTEVLRAVRPAMATIPDAKLILISTGYAMAGVLYELHRQHYGKDGSPVLVWQADTRTMNPRISQEFIDEQIELDPEAGRSEWGGLFREDISQAFPIELIDGCIIPGRIELPPVQGIFYRSFDDPMGGQNDSWAKTIAHREGDKVVVDLLRMWHPGIKVHEIARESAELGRLYGLTATTGDNYAGEWPKEAFAAHGVSYSRCEKSKSDLYLAAIPLMSSKRIELPDNERMRKEFRRLERKRGRGGKDSIQDGGRHDDLVNSIVGAVECCMQGPIGEPCWSGGETTCNDWNFYQAGLFEAVGTGPIASKWPL